MIPEFLKSFELKYRDLFYKSSLAYWNAAINGTEENWREVTKYQIEIIRLFRDRNYFEEIKKLHSRNSEFDPLIQRQIKILYNEFIPNQYDLKKLEEITNIQNKIENVFTTFRAKFDGKTLTDNEIDEILKNEINSSTLRKVWESSKEIGELIADDLINLVKLRNEQARSLGYKNYHEMSLILSELVPEEVDLLFKELENKTEAKFLEIKNQIDGLLAERYKIDKSELMPWHYQQRFFQEAPPVYSINFDYYFNDIDLVEITRNYFQSIGLDIDNLIQKSDLFERNGKN
ncbi:MAG: M2 family metallopeptidase, partial [Ignavibacteria bacterium]